MAPSARQIAHDIEWQPTQTPSQYAADMAMMSAAAGSKSSSASKPRRYCVRFTRYEFAPGSDTFAVVASSRPAAVDERYCLLCIDEFRTSRARVSLWWVCFMDAIV